MCLPAAPEQDSKALRQQQLKSFSTELSSFMDCSGLNWVLRAGSLPKLIPHPVPVPVPSNSFRARPWHFRAPLSV